MRIAEAGKKLGLSANMLRYYEHISLLPKVKRNKNGIRDYTEEDCLKKKSSPLGALGP